MRALGTRALETETSIYAWALMTNHAHILLRSGPSGLPRYMRRFLSCKKENISVEALKSGSRRQKVSAIRSQLARKLVEEWGVSLTEAGRHLGVSPSAIAKTLYRLNSHKSN